MLNKPGFWLLAIIAVGATAYYYQTATSDPQNQPVANSEPASIKLLVGGPDPYWKMVIAGAEDAASKFNAKLDVFVPESIETSVAEQTTQLSKFENSSADGLMISPLDPEKQTKLISTVAASKYVVTFDTEAPQAISHYHVGANNKLGGELAADLIRQAVPDGGEVAIFVGDLTRETGRLRRQVLINRLAQKSDYEPVSDSLDEPITAGDYTIVGTYLDDRDPEKAKANAAAALEKHSGLKCMVGLYSKNGPACVEAVKDAEKSADVKIVAFDQLEATLQAIRDGEVFGAVVQDPFAYGYEGVRLLCDMHRSQGALTPQKYSGFLTVAFKVVNAENIEEYESELESQLK